MISFSIFHHPKTNIYEHSTIIYHPMIYGQTKNLLIQAKLKPNTHFRFLKCASFWPNVLALRWWTCLNFLNRLIAVVNSYRRLKHDEWFKCKRVYCSGKSNPFSPLGRDSPWCTADGVQWPRAIFRYGPITNSGILWTRMLVLVSNDRNQQNGPVLPLSRYVLDHLNLNEMKEGKLSIKQKKSSLKSVCRMWDSAGKKKVKKRKENKEKKQIDWVENAL